MTALASTKEAVLLNLKNVFGWRTKRKIIVFSVDDYGNVRLDSKKARAEMDKAGMKVASRFDAYDTLETREDLEMLYETLASVKDQHGNSAVFTPFALPCNINFEALQENKFSVYERELLPDTYQKLAARTPEAYEGTWQLWQEGIAKGLLVPEFHGREHLNLKVLEEKLARKDTEVLTALQNRSYTSISNNNYPTIGYTVAFAFWEEEDLQKYPAIIRTGLQDFEQVYGRKSTVFTPPAQQFHPSLEPVIWQNGVQAMDKPLMGKQHLGKGNYKRQWNTSGYSATTGKVTLVRNVVFEPTQTNNIDWVSHTLKQIEAAFRWNRPAIISSHRVNFCGHVDPENRKKGISTLQKLLKQIVQRWPDVEFMAANELSSLINKSTSYN